MSYLRTHSVFLGFSALAALALAIGCSQAGDDGESSTAGDSTGDAGDAATGPVSDAGPRAPQSVVISQVYGGGGNSGAAFQNDFVELFNRGDSAVPLKGLSVQYIGYDKPFANNASIVNLPDVTLKAGNYFLIQLAGNPADAAPVGAALPTPDYVATTSVELINMSKSDGKIALVASNALLNGCGAAGTPCADGTFLDIVGFGKATQYEGAPVAALDSTKSATRKLGGCMAFWDNQYDFEVDIPAPRNGATAPSPLCSTVDAGAPPPPPTPPSADAGTTTKSDAGSTTHSDGGSSHRDAGHGKGTTAGDDDDSLETPTGADDGSSDPDGTHPESAADGAKPPAFPATSPSCSTTMSPSNSTGFAGLFGLALVAGALRRRKK